MVVKGCSSHYQGFKIFWILGLSILMLSFSLFAAGSEILDELQDQIQTFVLNHVDHEQDEAVSVTLKPLDSLKLAPCSEPLRFHLVENSRSKTVSIRCEGIKHWQVHLPVHIQILTRVLLAKKNIAAGESLDESMLSFGYQDKTRLYDGYFQDKSEAIGLVALRSIAQGLPLSKRNLKQLPLVRRGQTITLALRHGPIEIDMIGIAKTDGFKQEQVKVLNPSSKKVVEAIVTGKNRAEIIY